MIWLGLALTMTLDPGLARAQASPALGKMIYHLGEEGDPNAAAYLRGKLSHPNPHIRRIAAHALGKLASPESLVPLLALVQDPVQPVMVRCAALGALAKCGGPLAHKTIQALGQHPQRRLRQMALRLALPWPQQAARRGQ